MYKKRDRTDPENYRPISLLRHPKKIVEATIDKLLRAKYKFQNSQIGFRPGHGTEIVLLRCNRSLATGDRLSELLDLKAD